MSELELIECRIKYLQAINLLFKIKKHLPKTSKLYNQVDSSMEYLLRMEISILHGYDSIE